jgi:hypothetical protein
MGYAEKLLDVFLFKFGIPLIALNGLKKSIIKY